MEAELQRHHLRSQDRREDEGCRALPRHTPVILGYPGHGWGLNKYAKTNTTQSLYEFYEYQQKSFPLPMTLLQLFLTMRSIHLKWCLVFRDRRAYRPVLLHLDACACMVMSSVWMRVHAFTFTFSHLAEAFVLSDVQGREVKLDLPFDWLTFALKRWMESLQYFYWDHAIPHFVISNIHTFYKELMNHPGCCGWYNSCKCHGGVSNNLGIASIEVFFFSISMSAVNYADYTVKIC